MRPLLVWLCVLVVCNLASSKIYLSETFDDSWASRWVVSTWKDKEGTAGVWGHGTGPWFGDENKDKGLRTTVDSRFYAVSRQLDEVIDLDKSRKDLVVQFSVKHPQKMDCGGGYLKLLGQNVKQAQFGGSTPFTVKVGPDICGTQKKDVLFSLSPPDEGVEHSLTKFIRCFTDRLTHVYRLVLHPDNTFSIALDGDVKHEGSIYTDLTGFPDSKKTCQAWQAGICGF